MPYMTEIILGLAILSLLLNLLLFIRQMLLNRRIKKFMRGLSDMDVEALMQTYVKDLSSLREHVLEKTDERVLALEDRMKTSIRNVAAVSYNAFENMGNNMSFSTALLDDARNGVILTGIYGRDSSYVYMKPVKKGKPDKELSKEEKDVLTRAFSTHE